jgi:hypothetical protein
VRAVLNARPLVFDEVIQINGVHQIAEHHNCGRDGMVHVVNVANAAFLANSNVLIAALDMPARHIAVAILDLNREALMLCIGKFRILRLAIFPIQFDHDPSPSRFNRNSRRPCGAIILPPPTLVCRDVQESTPLSPSALVD